MQKQLAECGSQNAPYIWWRKELPTEVTNWCSVQAGLSPEKISDSDCVRYLTSIWRHFFWRQFRVAFSPINSPLSLTTRLGPYAGLWILHQLNFDKILFSKEWVGTAYIWQILPVRGPCLTVEACICVVVWRGCSSRVVTALGWEAPSSPSREACKIFWVTLRVFLLRTCGHWIRVATAIVLTVEGAVVISRPEELSLFCVDNGSGEMMRGL